jgi:hypothetical protein
MTTTTGQQAGDGLRQTRAVGALMVIAALLEVAAMAHHPSVRAHDMAQVLAQIRHDSGASGLVHGVLIVLMLVTLVGFSEFCLRRDLRRLSIRAAYATGTLAMIGAALVSGFIVPDLAARLARATPDELQLSGEFLALCRSLNRTLAVTGVLAMSAAIASWSGALLAERRAARWLAALGIAAAVLPGAALALGQLKLDVAGMGAVVALQAAWSAGVGLLLMRAPIAR